jgi:hypothetical protein
MGLQSFERGLERMVEGVFRGSRSTIRPVELGRRLLREMDDHRNVDVKGQRIVPNEYTFAVSPSDDAALRDIGDALLNELEEAAREYARTEGYHFMGPVTVHLDVDESQRPGRFTVSSHMREGEGGVRAGSLVLPSGERVPVGSRPVVIGRLPECAITLTDSNVSRRHSEVRSSGSGYVVVDLGSTNGTKVNGARIQGEQLLRDGDIVSLGSTHLRFEAS